MKYCLLILAFFFSLSSYALQINEIRIDQPGGDDDEYFEILGNPFESLDGIVYLVIGDGTGGDGTIEAVVDLTGTMVGASGLFTAAESTFTLATADLTTTINFENSDNVTHLLVSGFTGANGDDLDIDDDGTLDSMPWTEIIDSVALKENDTGELLYSTTIVGPDGTFVPGHVFRCDEEWNIGDFSPVGATDTPTAENDCGTDPTDPVALTIPEIQGAGLVSPHVGTTVITTGVVTADFQGGDELRGFFLQDQSGDGNTLTSDGIFVFLPFDTSVANGDVGVGDIVEIVASVAEFNELTELTSVQSVTVTGTATITPTMVSLPEVVNDDLERYEGMLVEIASPMIVAQNFFLGRYGQMTLSSPDDLGMPGRLYQPTNVFEAGSPEAIALAEENARRILILDDGQDISGLGDNPVPVPYLDGPPPGVIRAGDAVSNLVGVLDYGRINSAFSDPARDYRLHPTEAPVFTAQNLREAIPATTNGQINVASFNLLNFFSTLDDSGSICGVNGDERCRGADTASEYARQLEKLVSAIVAMDADVVGLVELENNGSGAGSAAQALVDAVNAALGDAVYTTVDVGSALGTDVIAVGMIYKPAVLEIAGTPATLATGAFDQTLEDGRSRQPLAVSFTELANNEQFTVVVNHFKSKRAPNDPQGNGNDDQGDGQGSWNMMRVEAANDLSAWLATAPTGIDDPDILITGDINAYAEEDPILAFEANGYTDQIQRFLGTDSYSFIFDGMSGSLDHALASESLAEQITGVIEWHINADEPSVIGYDENFNPAGYFNGDPFRSADHDPVIVGLLLDTDEDDDGVKDDDDFCPGTPAGATVDIDGCSGQQIIDENCESLFPHYPGAYIACTIITTHSVYRQGLISRSEARNIIRRAIRRVIFYYYGFR